MYKRHLRQIGLLENPEMFGGVTLARDNEWCKLAKLIPWHEFKDEYTEFFRNELSVRNQFPRSPRVSVDQETVSFFR